MSEHDGEFGGKRLTAYSTRYSLIVGWLRLVVPRLCLLRIASAALLGRYQTGHFVYLNTKLLLKHKAVSPFNTLSEPRYRGTMWESLQLPYFADPSSLPAFLPTEQEIEASTDVISRPSYRRVVIVGKQFFVKYGTTVEALLVGAESLFFVQQNLAIRFHTTVCDMPWV